MQQRPWKSALARTAGTLVLCAVPTLALAFFAPSAFSALAAPAPQAQLALANSVHRAASSGVVESTDLNDFSETKASLTQLQAEDTAFLAAQKSVSFSTSKMLNAAASNALTLSNSFAKGSSGQLIYSAQYTYFAKLVLNFDTFYKTISGTNSVTNTVSVLNSTTIVLTAIVTLNQVSTQSAINNTPGSVSSLTPPTF